MKTLTAQTRKIGVAVDDGLRLLFLRINQIVNGSQEFLPIFLLAKYKLRRIRAIRAFFLRHNRSWHDPRNPINCFMIQATGLSLASSLSAAASIVTSDPSAVPPPGDAIPNRRAF